MIPTHPLPFGDPHYACRREINDLARQLATSTGRVAQVLLQREGFEEVLQVQRIFTTPQGLVIHVK